MTSHSGTVRTTATNVVQLPHTIRALCVAAICSAGCGDDPSSAAPTRAAPPTRSPACASTVAPTTWALEAEAHTAQFRVQAAAACEWTAASGVDWLTITNGRTGTGNGVVDVSASPNRSLSRREGTLTIAQQTVTVTQEAPLHIRGAYTFEVRANDQCGWREPVHQWPVAFAEPVARPNDAYVSSTRGMAGNPGGLSLDVTYSLADKTVEVDVSLGSHAAGVPGRNGSRVYMFGKVLGGLPFSRAADGRAQIEGYSMTRGDRSDMFMNLVTPNPHEQQSCDASQSSGATSGEMLLIAR